MIDLHIDRDLQGLIPPPTDHECAALEVELTRDGCRDPLIVWFGERPVCQACGTPADPWPPAQYEEPFPGEGPRDPRYDTEHYIDEDRGGKYEWRQVIRDAMEIVCPNLDCEYSDPDAGYEVLWTLLDGHTRYGICRPRGLRFDITEAPAWVQTKTDAQIWIIQTQLARRNLEPYAKGELALALAPLLAEQARERMVRGTAPDPSENLRQGRTSDQLGELAGVSGRTMDKVKVIAKEADEPTKAALRHGERSIDSAYRELRPTPESPTARWRKEYPEFVHPGIPADDFRLIAEKLDAMTPEQRLEYRERWKRRDQNALAELLDEPPISEPTPQQVAGWKATEGWEKYFLELSVLASSVQEGWDAMMATWPTSRKQAAWQNLRQWHVLLGAWITAIEENMNHGTEATDIAHR